MLKVLGVDRKLLQTCKRKFKKKIEVLERFLIDRIFN